MATKKKTGSKKSAAPKKATAKVKKTTKAAPKKQAAKKSPVKKKKAAAEKKSPAAAKPKKTSASTDAFLADLENLDRKGLSAKARQIKKELLAIRFNLQNPSLQDYRKKKKELSRVLGHLA